MTGTRILFRGWAAHNRNCDFHLNTLIIHNDVKIVVSTVGEKKTKNCKLIPLNNTKNRYYQTAVFKAKDDINNTADRENQITDFEEYYMTEVEASVGHYETCRTVLEVIKSSMEG